MAGDGGTGRPARPPKRAGKCARAKELLKQASLPPEQAERIGNRIAAVEGDLEDQIARARGTLEGVFPLTRFLTSPLFADSGPTAAYRLIDDPAVKATRDAAADLAAQRARAGKEVGAIGGGDSLRFPRQGLGRTRPPQSSQGSQDRSQARAVQHGRGKHSADRRSFN